MSTRMATGLAKGSDSEATARAAVESALRRFGSGSPELVILYCSSLHDYAAVLATVRSLTPGSALIGASTAGEFTEDRVETGSVAVGLIASEDIRFFTGLAEGIDRDLETAVGSIITKIPLEVPGYPHRCLLLLTDGMVGNGEEITLLVSNMAGQGTQVVGGLAADDFEMEKTVVFHGDKFAEKAASICVMASRKPFFTSVNHGHCPLTEPLRITRAEGNVVYEVDGRPAWEVWKEKTARAARELGIDVEEIGASGDVAAYFSNFELGLHTGEGQYKMRYPMSINPDGSINFTCTIPNGASIRIMDGHDLTRQIAASRRSAEQVRATAEAAGQTEFAGALVIECAVRQFLLGERFPEAVEVIRDVLGGAPILGAETYGEMRLEPGEFSGLHNTTTVVLLIP